VFWLQRIKFVLTMPDPVADPATMPDVHGNQGFPGASAAINLVLTA
jgi:hypothetical protein